MLKSREMDERNDEGFWIKIQHKLDHFTHMLTPIGLQHFQF